MRKKTDAVTVRSDSDIDYRSIEGDVILNENAYGRKRNKDVREGEGRFWVVVHSRRYVSCDRTEREGG